MEQEPFMFYKNFTSAVRMPIEMPGKIKCEACNAVGCRFSIETVLVSGNNDFDFFYICFKPTQTTPKTVFYFLKVFS